MQTFLTRKHFIYTVSNSRDCITNSQRGSVLALALWHYLCCLHAAVCEMRRFKLLFRINANVYLQRNYTRILLRPSALSSVCIVRFILPFCSSRWYNAIMWWKHLPIIAPSPEDPRLLWPIWVIVLNCILIESAISQKLTVFSAYILPWTRYVPPKFSLSLGGCRPVSHCFIDPCMHDPVNAARKVSVTPSCHCQHM